jgi:hypothetical protein
MPSHDETIGQAYVEGMIAARDGLPEKCDYFQHTQQFIAFSSGFRDQITWAAARAQGAPDGRPK